VHNKRITIASSIVPAFGLNWTALRGKNSAFAVAHFYHAPPPLMGRYKRSRFRVMFKHKEALLLDMNSTFMFGEDRFGATEDYSKYYRSIGGNLPDDLVNDIIGNAYNYLADKYPSEEYMHCFPSLETAIEASSEINIPFWEKGKIVKTFAYHEHGHIPQSYVQALVALKNDFTLALVIDIWAPKKMWINTFEHHEIWRLFSAYSFSSDHGMVKPSPKPFEMVVSDLGLTKNKCLVIGDSVRRDLGGALNASIDCVLVGGSKSDLAVGEFPTLLDFQKNVSSSIS